MNLPCLIAQNTSMPQLIYSYAGIVKENILLESVDRNVAESL